MYRTIKWGPLQVGFWIKGKYWSFSYLEVSLIYNRTFRIMKHGVINGRFWLIEIYTPLLRVRKNV